MFDCRYTIEQHSGDDNLGNLPDHLIQQIFSFFECSYESINMLAVSKHLRRLYMSIRSSMAFSLYLHQPSSLAHFYAFFNKLLSVSHGTRLSTLSLSWHRSGPRNTLHCYESIPDSQGLPALQTLVIKYFGLELLDFSSLGKLISNRFPRLKKLVLQFENCTFNDALVISVKREKDEDSSPLSLIELEISFIDCSPLHQDRFVVRIDCPSLEMLTFKNFKLSRGTMYLTVLANQLTTLVMDNVELLISTRRNSVQHTFKIYALGLRSFHWKGSPIQNYFVTSTLGDKLDFEETFPWLEEAVIDVRRKIEPWFYNEFLNKLLGSVQHATNLQVRQPISTRICGFYARRYVSDQVHLLLP